MQFSFYTFHCAKHKRTLNGSAAPLPVPDCVFSVRQKELLDVGVTRFPLSRSPTAKGNWVRRALPLTPHERPDFVFDEFVQGDSLLTFA
jgi:hypothetical protein